MDSPERCDATDPTRLSIFACPQTNSTQIGDAKALKLTSAPLNDDDLQHLALQDASHAKPVFDAFTVEGLARQQVAASERRKQDQKLYVQRNAAAREQACRHTTRESDRQKMTSIGGGRPVTSYS
jgi:hypothetical protein